MKNDEFIERIREGINHGMWIRNEVDKQSLADGKALSEVEANSMRTWMGKQIQSMLDNMTMIDIIYISDNRELSPTGVSPRYGDLWRWYPEELEKKKKEIAEWKKKGGQAPEVSSAVDNDDETTTNSSSLSIPQEEENGK